MTVREALVSDPLVLTTDASVPEAAELLSRPEIRSVLVVDGDRLVGEIGPDGVLEAVAKASEIGALTVGDICEPNVVTIGPNASLYEALRLMSSSAFPSSRTVACLESSHGSRSFGDSLRTRRRLSQRKRARNPDFEADCGATPYHHPRSSLVRKVVRVVG